MRTALDTNIISALWSNEPGAADILKRLGEAREAGTIVVSGVVDAELLAYPNATETFVNDFCEQTRIAIEFRFQDAVWTEAGRRFSKYAARRRNVKEHGPKRLLADFLVGAHALLQAGRLMALDPGRCKRDFPELHL